MTTTTTPTAIATVVQDGDELIVTLTDGTEVHHWYHVCPNCTSADTWVHQDTPDPQNETGDPHRQTVDIAVWNRQGGRKWETGTSTNHVVRHDQKEA